MTWDRWLALLFGGWLWSSLVFAFGLWWGRRLVRRR